MRKFPNLLQRELDDNEFNIFTYKVGVTKITDSRSDDWIYWHFGYNHSYL
jgi:hypothetical protein